MKNFHKLLSLLICRKVSLIESTSSLLIIFDVGIGGCAFTNIKFNINSTIDATAYPKYSENIYLFA